MKDLIELKQDSKILKMRVSLDIVLSFLHECVNNLRIQSIFEKT